MAGFGNSSFGNTRFGWAEWSRMVTWESLPESHKERDRIEGYPQREFLTPYERELEIHHVDVVNMGLLHQKRPLKIRTKVDVVTVDIDSSEVIEDDYWGTSVLLTISTGEDISDVGVGYEIRDVDATDPNNITVRTYKVVRIRSRNEPDSRNEVLLKGPAIELQNTSVTFSRPSLVRYMASDFGLTVDDLDPISSQRSALAHRERLRSVRSAESSYEIRGAWAGFDVQVYGLWEISEGYYNSLPGFATYILNGKYYTTLDPIMIAFDEIPADIAFDDPDLGSSTTLLDRPFFYDDASVDGVSPARAFGANVLKGYFAPAVAEGGDGESLTIAVTGSTGPGVDNLFTVTATMTQGQRDKIGYFTAGVFILEDSTTGARFYIEEEVSFSPNTITLKTSGPSAPPNGNYYIVYEPKVRFSCDYCRSSLILVDASPTDELISQLDGYGQTIEGAYERLEIKLNEVKPVHVEMYIRRVTPISLSFPAPPISMVIT